MRRWRRPSPPPRRCSRALRRTASAPRPRSASRSAAPSRAPSTRASCWSSRGVRATAGAAEVVFADTIGVAVPSQATELVEAGLELGVPIGVHLHNTRNTAIACAYAALQCRRDRVRRLRGRRRRLPVRAERDGQRRDGRPRLPAARRRRRDGHRPRRADRGRALAGGAAGPAARRPRAPRWKLAPRRSAPARRTVRSLARP